jgi:ubiquinone/menaquinone biosynthesis C-methylase UbiE
MQNRSDSWEHVAHWYDSLIGEKGGYYHTHVIFPKTLSLLTLKENNSVLDLACGQGAFSRLLAQKGMKVTGVDASESLINAAKQYEGNEDVQYAVDDARSLESLGNQKFDRIVSILALQNIDPLDPVFRRVHELLVDGGRFVGVILHPAFRSPRITGWGEDPARKLQFRRVDRYLSDMQIPITMHPGQSNSEMTWTYHRPLSAYVTALRQAHLYVDAMEEWVSDKQSVGKKGKQENLARDEIPMFLAFRAKRIDHA